MVRAPPQIGDGNVPHEISQATVCILPDQLPLNEIDKGPLP